ncbi:MAG TPA: carboxypeptidase-like regulatory domain-containing protein, partial [Chryseolinea sp.]|nr:carboxypeptidase-like regulatory domain-containing protein [Chryseolinea sp.]
MKYFYLPFLILSHLTLFGQSSGSINGIVKTSDGNPAEYVNISIKGTSKGAVANENGKYVIKNVAPGNYTLTASFIGLESQQQTITVIAGQATTADFTLNENTTELEEV